jgi:hypothetical protein
MYRKIGWPKISYHPQHFCGLWEKDTLKYGKSENGTFPLLYIMKMTLHRGVGGGGGLKSPKTPLQIYKCSLSLKTYA